jgi:hypothetical protein
VRERVQRTISSSASVSAPPTVEPRYSCTAILVARRAPHGCCIQRIPASGGRRLGRTMRRRPFAYPCYEPAGQDAAWIQTALHKACCVCTYAAGPRREDGGGGGRAKLRGREGARPHPSDKCQVRTPRTLGHSALEARLCPVGVSAGVQSGFEASMRMRRARGGHLVAAAPPPAAHSRRWLPDSEAPPRAAFSSAKR